MSMESGLELEHAPVVLFVYNRPRHTQATLTALAANHGAQRTHLWVFCDGAKNDADGPNVEKVRQTVRSATGFASLRCVEREQNWGLAKSVIVGVQQLFERYEKVIVLEDDVVTSPHFLAFMNEALQRYGDVSQVFSLGGWRPPEPQLVIPTSYPFDTFVTRRCCSWGWGVWRDRWLEIDWDVADFDDFMADSEAQSEFNRGGGDLTRLLSLQRHGKIDSWAIRFCYAHFASRRFCIRPVKTLVHNIGLDGSGTHCGHEPELWESQVDPTWRPARYCPGDWEDPVVAERFRLASTPVVRSLPNRALRRLKRLWVPHR